MNTNCKRLIHVTFAIGVLVLAMSASTPAAALTAHSQKFEPVMVRGTEVEVAQPANAVRTRTGEFTYWILNRRGVLAIILRSVALVPVKEALPVGVVVDDGVPF